MQYLVIVLRLPCSPHYRPHYRCNGRQARLSWLNSKRPRRISAPLPRKPIVPNLVCIYRSSMSLMTTSRRLSWDPRRQTIIAEVRMVWETKSTFPNRQLLLTP